MRTMAQLSPAELATLAATMGDQLREVAARLQIERPEFILILVREEDSEVASTCPRHLASQIMRRAAKRLEDQGAAELEDLKSGVG